jgi:hypothetical protein
VAFHIFIRQASHVGSLDPFTGSYHKTLPLPDVESRYNLPTLVEVICCGTGERGAEMEKPLSAQQLGSVQSAREVLVAWNIAVAIIAHTRN